MAPARQGARGGDERAARQAPARESQDDGAELSYRDAQTALELCLAELQAADLDVERMAALYRRAQRYADRCEALLDQVEQEVMQWDPQRPEDAPQVFQP